MQHQNFYPEQLVDVDNLMDIQLQAENTIKDIMKSLQAQGILSGLNIVPTNPAATLAVVIHAGKIATKSGSIVIVGNDVTIDLSAQGVVAGVGGSRWITIIAVGVQQSDTPISTPGGVVQYRTFDQVNFQLVVGGEAIAGQQAVRPGPDLTDTGIIIGDIHRVFGQAAFQIADIDMTRAQPWYDVPGILAYINNHIYTIDHVNGLQAALDGKSPLGHGHLIGDILGLQAALDSKLTNNVIDCQVNGAPIVMDGTNKVIFQTVIPAGTVKPTHKGIRISLRFGRPVGHNLVTYNILFNNIPAINFPAYAPVAGAQGNLTTDKWDFILSNVPGQNNSQVLWNDSLINAAPPVGGGQISTATVAESGTNIDWSQQVTIQWVANGPGPDQVSPGLWLVEFLR